MEFLLNCAAFADESANLKFVQVISLARNVVTILQIIVPIALIVWGTIDLAKAVIEGDEKKMKEKRKPFIQRIVSAIIVFLVPWLVNLIFNIVGNGSTWHTCWVEAKDQSWTNIFDDGDTMGDGTKIE